MPLLVFSRKHDSLSYFSKIDGGLYRLTTSSSAATGPDAAFDARGYVDSTSNGPWPMGLYKAGDRKLLTEKELELTKYQGYSKGGFFEFKDVPLYEPLQKPGGGTLISYDVWQQEFASTGMRTGMQIHAGRTDKPFDKTATFGCIRTKENTLSELDDLLNIDATYSREPITNLSLLVVNDIKYITVGSRSNLDGGVAVIDQSLVTGKASGASLTAGDHNDYVFGGSLRGMTLTGGKGDDYIYGGSKNDTIYGNSGTDRIFAGDGNDSVITGGDEKAKADYVDAGAGNDRITGGKNWDYIAGQSGDDWVVGGEGNDLVYGDSSFARYKPSTELNSTVVFDWRAQKYLLIKDSQYRDLVWQDSPWSKEILWSPEIPGEPVGSDELRGGEGNDSLYGGPGNDRLFGDKDNDRLSGGAGDDAISGGEGNDTIYGGKGRDKLDGGEGSDQYLLLDKTDVINDTGSEQLLTDDEIYFVLNEIDTASVGAASIEHFYYIGSTKLFFNHNYRPLEGEVADYGIVVGDFGSQVIVSASGSVSVNGGRGFDTVKVNKNVKGGIGINDEVERLDLTSFGVTREFETFEEWADVTSSKSWRGIGALTYGLVDEIVRVDREYKVNHILSFNDSDAVLF